MIIRNIFIYICTNVCATRLTISQTLLLNLKLIIMTSQKIVVVGSNNTNLVVTSEKLPIPEKTALNELLLRAHEDKDANQAIIITLPEKRQLSQLQHQTYTGRRAVILRRRTFLSRKRA